VNNSSLPGRAVLALILLAGFYVLAIGIAAALAYLAYVDIKYSRHIHLRLILGCVLGVGGILWAVLPRPDKFQAPGPRFHAIRHARLFQELTKTAGAVEQALPGEVYLIPEMNAWVSHRGGFMGFGSRRVMGLGLPLLQTLTVSELRAVLAHEFGHFYGGDVRLAPWIYKTRSAIGRTLHQLDDSLIQLPFVWYGRLFLRITNSVARRQEYAADALAARIVGNAPLIGGLKKVNGAAGAFDAYWHSEVVPILSAGFRPPVAEGFALFLASPHITARVAENLEEEMQASHSDPYDTHPCLKERIEALAALPSAVGQLDDRRAMDLIDGVEALELEMLQVLFEEEDPGGLRPIGWKDALSAVYLPAWRQTAREHIRAFEGIRLGELPELAGKPQELSARFEHPDAVTGDEKWEGACRLFGTAIVAALADRGHAIACEPGDPVLVEIGGERFNPFTILSNLASDRITAAKWKRLCAADGLEQLRLDAALHEDSRPEIQTSSER